MFIHKCFHHAGESGMFEILQLKSTDIDQPPSLWIATCESNPPKSPCFMHRLGRKKTCQMLDIYYFINHTISSIDQQDFVYEKTMHSKSDRSIFQHAEPPNVQGLLGCLRRQAIGFFSVGRRPCDIAKGNLKQVSSSIVSKRKNP